MMKSYQTPEITLSWMVTEDILTTSGYYIDGRENGNGYEDDIFF